MNKERYFIQHCIQHIEGKLGWGPSHSWHNDMFIELSERIQSETKVLLSPVTLKRVWGRVAYKGAPSITTLNTLAQFAGFENWRDLKGRVPGKKKSGTRQKIQSNLGVIVLSASVMTLVFISLYSLRSVPIQNEPIDPSRIVFESRPITQGLPNSVVFNLDLEGVESDSIHIQQYWDRTKTISLTKGQKQATGQYYFPGYFRAKLLVDGEIIKEHDLFIKSDGWLGTIDYGPIPKYHESSKVFSTKLSFPKDALDEITSSEKQLTSTFHMVKAFDSISGDNFELKSVLKNTYNDVWAVCQKTSIIVLGTKGAMVVTLGIPGCASELWVMMNDNFLHGKEHDLSKLGLDLSTEKEITLRVVEKELLVTTGNQTLFQGDYSESLGRIAGIRYRFFGTGEVYQSILSDLKGETSIDFMDQEIVQ